MLRLRTSISTMTSLISFLMFMLLLTTTSAQSPIYMYNFCQNITGKSLSTTSYQTNLNNLLSWILSDSAASKGYNRTTITNNSGSENDAVYGTYECRGDVTGYFCQFCLSTAVREIVQRCPNGASAVIWYDICIVRYSDHSFFGEISLSPIWNVTGSENIKDSTEAVKAEDAMQGLIRKATVESNQSWEISEFNWGGGGIEKRYGLVQCARDITSDQCRQCLEGVLEKVPECCGTKVAWAVMTPSCGTKFDDHMFSHFSNQTTSPSPLPNPGKCVKGACFHLQQKEDGQPIQLSLKDEGFMHVENSSTQKCSCCGTSLKVKSSYAKPRHSHSFARAPTPSPRAFSACMVSFF